MKIAQLAAAILASILIEVTCHAQFVIPSRWWSNRGSSQNVVEFGAGSEFLRLQGGYTSGFLEGTVSLPMHAAWKIEIAMHTDESVNLPSEFVDTFINGVFVKRLNNTPPLTTYSFEHSVIGNSFNYRFEFSSLSTTFSDHMVVRPGFATAISEPASVVDSHINHVGYNGIGTSMDANKILVKEGTEPQLLTYDNLINTSQGINGIVFDIENLPDAGNLSAEDFQFQMSPTGAFDAGANPPANWQSAPAPSSISVTPGSPDRVLIQWPDQSILNRWLRITILANEKTGLAEPETYYIGHLLGETTGPTDGVFTVSFADITPIRADVGQTVDASSITDIDKNGTVSFADISAMRGNVGSQLTQINVP